MSLETEQFGTIAMIEVGAALVGSIVQTYTPNTQVSKGEEKGFFQFGGSTVILLFEPEQLMIDDDLIANTLDGYETLVKMGEGIGKKTR
jgi:phosphatidylserine decarboxylase